MSPCSPLSSSHRRSSSQHSCGDDGASRREVGRAGRRSAFAAIIVLIAIVTAACSETSMQSDSSGPNNGPAQEVTSRESQECRRDLLVCAEASSLADLLPVKPSDVSGENGQKKPLIIGMMNQESSPAGSYLVLSGATRGAVNFINAKLGGVNGRPIDLRVCDTGFSSEQSVSCAQGLVDQGASVVLGGVDVFGSGIDVLGQNGVSFAGGLPISNASAVADNSYQWSGGAWAATVAFASDALTHSDERAAIVYPEFGPITEAAEFGRDVLVRGGVKVALVPYQITATDLGPALQSADSTRPDSVVVLGADTACRSALKAAHDIDISARKYYLGACAAPSVTRQLPRAATEGVIFNVEGPISATDPDTVLYGAVMAEYAPEVDAIGAATVAFRSTMNLYRVLRSIDASAPGRGEVATALRASKDQPSFMGHAFTCDREQMAGLPAFCSPQQRLVKMEGGKLVQVGSWIDVGKIHSR